MFINFFSFCHFHHFALNCLSLCFVTFFTFCTVWVFQKRVGKVNLNWLEVFLIFFLLNFGFFIRLSSWNYFFYPDLILRVVGSLSYSKLTRVLFFIVVFFKGFFLFSYLISSYWVLNFTILFYFFRVFLISYPNLYFI